jgi:N-acyl-D-amino-acid deacylase
MLRKLFCCASLATFALCISACSPDSATEVNTASSLLIINARIVDGSGQPALSGALRIQGDTIMELGSLVPRAGETVVDARGQVLAPGFIDTHSHHDEELADNLDALPLLAQGITTAMFGQDGGHALPLDNFFAAYERHPASVNVASYVGHNSLREQVMGDARRPASAQELAAMNDLLARELRAGAIGLSTGLEYEPGIYSEREEVLSLAQTAARLGGRYISHIRSEDRLLWDAIDEIIEIGRQTKMPVQISHIKLAAKSLWGQSGALLAKLDAARAQGINITADVYPYEYWQSTMWVLLPDRDADNLEEIQFVLNELTPPSGIIFTRFEPEPGYVSQSVAEIAELRGTSEVQTFSDLLKEAAAWSAANGGKSAESIMGRSMTEDDIATFLAWPHANVCSDGGFSGHPRGYGAFPRVLARYVRDRNVMTLEAAIEAMTSRAATHLGIVDRGLIAPGYKADLVLFDPDTIQDRADIRDGQVLSTGVEHVWVNGTLVLENGVPSGERAGRVLRFSESAPHQ